VNSSGADQDNLHFAGLERDAESGTEHAQFRNYASAQGRWLAPDSYMGSYDLTNPQSMNRYAYALNNPTSFLDPSGLDYGYDCGDNCVGVVGTGDSGGGDVECWWCTEYGGGSGGETNCWWCALPPKTPLRLHPPQVTLLAQKQVYCPALSGFHTEEMRISAAAQMPGLLVLQVLEQATSTIQMRRLSAPLQMVEQRATPVLPMRVCLRNKASLLLLGLMREQVPLSGFRMRTRHSS
jgi:RHS repeat-associated protein